MKKIIFTISVLITALNLFGQTNFRLIARKENDTKVFETGNAVNVTYASGDTTASFRGRIDAIKNDEIVLRHYSNRDTTRLHVPLNNFTEIKKISRTGRTIGGIIFGTGLLLGAGEIASNSPASQISVPDIFGSGTYIVNIPATDYTGAALATIAIGSLPYIIVTLVESKASKNKGYTFIIAAR